MLARCSMSREKLAIALEMLSDEAPSRLSTRACKSSSAMKTRVAGWMATSASLRLLYTLFRVLSEFTACCTVAHCSFYFDGCCFCFCSSR